VLVTCISQVKWGLTLLLCLFGFVQPLTILVLSNFGLAILLNLGEVDRRFGLKEKHQVQPIGRTQQERESHLL
jgi:hypothetical protein